MTWRNVVVALSMVLLGLLVGGACAVVLVLVMQTPWAREGAVACCALVAAYVWGGIIATLWHDLRARWKARKRGE